MPELQRSNGCQTHAGERGQFGHAKSPLDSGAFDARRYGLPQLVLFGSHESTGKAVPQSGQ